jgi:hypothetical protein
VFGRCGFELDTYILQKTLTLSWLKAPSVLFGKYIVLNLKDYVKRVPFTVKEKAYITSGKMY